MPAAGVGSRLGAGAGGGPKCLLQVGGESLLERQARLLRQHGVEQIVLVVGHQGDRVIERAQALGLSWVLNPDFREGSILSLYAAREYLEGEVVLIDADMWYEGDFLAPLQQHPQGSFFLIDQTAANDGEAVFVGFNGGWAVQLARGLRGDFEALGEWAGVLKLDGQAAQVYGELLAERVAGGERDLGYEFLVPELLAEQAIGLRDVSGRAWVEIDFPGDLARARSLAAEVDL